ncbi:DUF502 domain-containing protein [Nitrospirota bacterium]
MRTIARYFMRGLLFITPLVVTVYVVYAVFTKVDRLFRLPIPGAGFMLTLFVITFVGFLASNFLTRWMTRLVEGLFVRLPFIKMIYTSVRDLVGAFVGEKKSFNQPVSVELVPGSGVSVAGFMTCENLSYIGIMDKVAVYLPQSYNFAGNLIIVPPDRVTRLDAVSGEVMAFIVSGGVSG